MEDQHLLPLVRELLLDIGLHKKDISGLEESKSNLTKNFKIENLSKFYVDKNSPNLPPSSELKALNLSPGFTPISSKKEDKFFLPPLSKKLNGRSVRKPKNDNLYSAANQFGLADTQKIRRYRKISKIFGCVIDDLPCINTYLHDGTVAYIPEVIYELSNVILKDVSCEGIFRKAGSAQRQNSTKDIINSGQKLPEIVQAVDAACLLKYFLRSLPSPLLSSNKIHLISKCLSLTAEKSEEALMLSFLSIPRQQRHILSYIFELFHVVASPDNGNRMDANSLAIILAPNFLSSIFRRQKKGWTSSANEKDDVLRSTITIIEALINKAHKMGRVPACLEEKIKSIYSAESLESITSSDSKKKRRSGSLQRLFIGLRKAVQGPMSGETPFEPLFNSLKPKSKRRSTDRYDNNSDAETAIPAGSVSKRKLIVLEDGLKFREKDLATPSPCIGRPRLSLDASSPPSLPPRRATAKKLEAHLPFDALVHSVQPKIMRPTRRGISVYGRYSLRDRVTTSSAAPKKRFAVAEMTARRQSLRSAGISPSFNLPVRKSSLRESHYLLRERKNSPKLDDSGGFKGNDRTQSMSNVAKKQDKSFEKQPLLRAHSEMSGISPAKSCVNSGTPRRTSPKSCLHLVQSTYEAVKLESKNFDCSPCESLSRGLSKELKLRSRRSAEYKVQRSPSERRISKIRRRSKENVPQKSPAGSIGLSDSPYAIRRGKPNTVASGLPLLCKPLNAADFKDCDKHLKLRTRSVSLIVNTSNEAFSVRDLSIAGEKNLDVEPSATALRPLRKSGEPCPLEEKLTTALEESPNGHSIKNRKSRKTNLVTRNREWVPVTEANLDNGNFTTANKPILNLAQHRMSIDALKRQKKVTANLKLFDGTGQASVRNQIVHASATKSGLNHTPAIKSARCSALAQSVLRTPRSRMTPLMNNNCFQGQTGFTPLPPKPFQPKRLLDDQSKFRTGTRSIPGSNLR